MWPMLGAMPRYHSVHRYVEGAVHCGLPPCSCAPGSNAGTFRYGVKVGVVAGAATTGPRTGDSARVQVLPASLAA